MMHTILLWVVGGLIALFFLAVLCYIIGYWFSCGWDGYVRGYEELQKKKEKK